MAYAIDPMQPLPRRWSDEIGPLRLLMTSPAEGYLMARRPGAGPFIISVRDLLGGKYTPVVAKKRINVREAIDAALSEEVAG